MSDHTMYKPATFCWNELASKDVGAAKKFYSQLLGWELKDGEVAPMIYTEIKVGEQSIGGMYQMTPEHGNAPSHWMPYVAVEDVEASARRVEELGGKVCVPPTDIPNVGRFCVINDPSGASLSLIKFAEAASS